MLKSGRLDATGEMVSGKSGTEGILRSSCKKERGGESLGVTSMRVGWVVAGIEGTQSCRAGRTQSLTGLG